MTRVLAILSFILTLGVFAPAVAQDADARATTGGAQTREDIMARQRGEKVLTRERTGDDAAGAAAAIAGQLGAKGSTSDSEVWEAIRFGTADVKVSTGKSVDAVLVQDGGMPWYEFRAGPLKTYGGYLLGGTLLLLLLFYLLRGKIRIDGEKTGETILRFNLLERCAHWLLAGSFILLAITGLAVLFGRTIIIPYLGHEAFSTIAVASKWVHNWVAWPFMVALVLVFVFWVLHNIPNRHDLV